MKNGMILLIFNERKGNSPVDKEEWGMKGICSGDLD
jgi:hypothetical protein